MKFVFGKHRELKKRLGLVKKGAGFTLLEILTVVAIIGVIAGFGATAFDKARDTGKDSRRRQDIAAVKTAATAYFMDHDFFAGDTCPICMGNLEYASDNPDGNWGLPGFAEYLKKYPKDPRQSGIFNTLLALFEKPKDIALNLLAKLPNFNGTKEPPSINLAQVNTKPEVAGVFTDAPFNAAGDGEITYGGISIHPADTSGTCTVDTTGTYSKAGQLFSSPQYASYRSYMYFDTSSIPANATITSARLHVANGNGKFFGTNSTAYLRSYNWGTSLACADWGGSPPTATIAGSFNTSSFPSTIGQGFDINISNLTGITKAGNTTFMLSTSREEINTVNSSPEYFTVGTSRHANTAYRPVLYVSYTTPDPNLIVTGAITDKTSYTPGEQMTITMVIENDSAYDIQTPFYIGWNTNAPSTHPACNPPLWNNYQQFSLNANTTVSIPIFTNAPLTPGTYNAGVFVDSTCQITESVEGTTGGPPNGENYNYPIYTVTASGQAPNINTTLPTNVTATSATLNGTVNPNGLTTNAWFRYGAGGTSCSGGSPQGATAPQSVGSGTSNFSFSANVTLNPSTTYYFCAVAQNSLGTSYGNIRSFSTSSLLPTASITASPPSIFSGTSSTISWSSTNATNCTVTPGSFTPGVSGSGSTGNLNAPPTVHTYTASCTGPGGTALDSVNVNVIPNSVNDSCRNKGNIYCYVVPKTLDRFFLYAKLDNLKSDEQIPIGSECDNNNPDKTSAKPFNYCVEAPK